MADDPVRYPLDGLGLASAAPAGARTVVRHVRGLAFVQLMARSGQADALAERLVIDVGPGRASDGDGFTALPLAPGHWLLMADHGRDGAFRAALAERAAGLGHASEQSHGRVALLLEGPEVATILARGCRLDTPALRPGFVAQTVMADIATLLYRPPGREGIMLILYPGYLESFRHWLMEIGAPYSPVLIEENTG